jgi:predicted small secreted protein
MKKGMIAIMVLGAILLNGCKKDNVEKVLTLK